MSIYLTTQVSYATKVEAFNLRGLQNQVSVRACDSGVYAISRSSSVTRLRFATLHDELPARLKKKTTNYTPIPVYTNVLAKFDRMHFEVPTLVVEMKSGGEILHAFGMFETGTSKMGLYAGKPTSEQIRQIMALGLDIYSSVPAGNVNLAGYCAFIQAWRGINAFFFMGGGDRSSEEQMGCGISRHTIDELHSIVSNDAKAEGAIVNFDVLRLATGGKGFCEPKQCTVIANPAEFAAWPGYVFPYFKEMLTADPDTPFQNFMSLYHHCFSASSDEVSGSVELIRRGFRFLASTNSGRIIQHIYFGMKLVIELGGIMRLVADGSEYAGFAIEGDGLSLLEKNRIRPSFSKGDVEVALENLSTHNGAVIAIYDAVIEITRMDGLTEEITKEECLRNPRCLRAMIQARKAVDINSVREILNEKVGLLRYNQTYWELNPKNLVRFLQLVVQHVKIMDEPMYPHIDVFTNRSSPILEYLSVFGGQAPSIYFGNMNKQISDSGAGDPNLQIIQGRRALPHIPYVKKGLIAAAADWATVKRTHSIKFQGPRKVGPGTGFSDAKARDGVVANPEFDEFYPLLRLWSYSETNDRQEGSSKKSGEKRKGPDVDMEEGTSKKPKVAYSFL